MYSCKLMKLVWLATIPDSLFDFNSPQNHVKVRMVKNIYIITLTNIETLPQMLNVDMIRTHLNVFVVCRNQNPNIYSGEFAGFMSCLSLFWRLQEVDHAARWNTRQITKRSGLENISDPIWVVPWVTHVMFVSLKDHFLNQESRSLS